MTGVERGGRECEICEKEQKDSSAGCKSRFLHEKIALMQKCVAKTVYRAILKLEINEWGQGCILAPATRKGKSLWAIPKKILSAL